MRECEPTLAELREQSAEALARYRLGVHVKRMGRAERDALLHRLIEHLGAERVLRILDGRPEA